MTDEQQLVAKYRVEVPEEAPPLMVVHEAIGQAEVRERKRWDLLDPASGEELAWTSRKVIAKAFRKVGGVTSERVVEREVKADIPKPEQETAWADEINQRAKDEGIHRYTNDGPGGISATAGTYNTVRVRTPGRLGIEEHLRRRQIVEGILDKYGFTFDVECVTEHSDKACRRLEPEKVELTVK